MISFFRRSLFQPLYGRITGSPQLSYWHQLEKNQYAAEETLRDIQYSRLSELIGFVWDKNEFYRWRMQRNNVTPDDIKSVHDLIKLPILTKAEVRENTSVLLSQGFNRQTLQQAKTGGSTGKALELYFTEECSELRNACARRHDLWTGWKPGEPIAACWGNPYLPGTLKEKLKHWLMQPMIYLDTMNVNEASVMTFVKEWYRVKPTLLYGHAHSIYLLVQYLISLGINSIIPKGILSTSMMLIPSERKVIEDFFGVKVIDRYGCEEVGLIGCECERHEGMHLNIEHLVVEFLRDDGSQISHGEPGRIVVTDLMNKAMPLIRYQVEDVGVPTNRKCSCGRGLPLMTTVTGRVADFLLRKDGSQVAGISLIENTLTHFPGLDQMQIVQNQIDQFDIFIVRGKGFSEGTITALKEYFVSQFGSEIKIQFKYVDGLIPDKNGKYRFSICKLI
jgi:phenylacetate-CoA ligase